MRYCLKCGNKMEDKMMFCWKCGAKFEENGNIPSEIMHKINVIKKYDLVMDKSTTTWNRIRTDIEGTGRIVNYQNNMLHEVKGLIEEVLSMVNEDNRYYVEKEIYTYVFTMAKKLCDEGARLFDDYKDWWEIYEQGKIVVNLGKMSMGSLLEKMYQLDKTYQMVSGIQGFTATRLKEVLDEDVIYNNLEYRKMCEELAKSYNVMWKKYNDRLETFFHISLSNITKTFLDNYEVVLKGLPFSVVDNLDENVWSFTIQNLVKSGKEEEANEIIKQKDAMYDSIKQYEREQLFWEAYPDKYKVAYEKKVQIRKINKSVSDMENEIKKLEEAQTELTNKVTEIEKEISDKKSEIKKLQKKIFGKKKTREEIRSLEIKISTLESQIEVIKKEIAQYDSPIAYKKDKQCELKKDIDNLKHEIGLLKGEV